MAYQPDLWRGWRLAMVVVDYTCVTDTPIKILNTKAQVNVPCWQHSMCYHTFTARKSKHDPQDFTGRGQQEFCIWNCPGPCPMHFSHC